MNLIHTHAIDFYQTHQYSGRNGQQDYKAFIEKVRTSLYDYRKVAHKIEFTDKIIDTIKQEYDDHMLVCKAPNTCVKNKFYENSLFFLQEEVEELEQQLPKEEFSRSQKKEALVSLEALIADLNTLKTGQQITYDDLMSEFKDLREFLYLEKKTLSQLMLGKLTEVVSGSVAGEVVNETVSKSLINMIKEHYPTLLNIKF